MAIDMGLIRKYDRPGPRYTSYPTAPLFSPDVADEALKAHLLATLEEVHPLSLYVHVPFCHKLCWYCGCNMKVSRNMEAMERHVNAIVAEMDLIKPHLNPERRAKQVHFGGGTPTYITPEQLLKLIGGLQSRFPFDPKAEISIEVDPRHIGDEKLDALEAGGFNRVSLGVQDFDPTVQAAVNRIQPYELVADRVTAIRKRSFEGLNFDLMYGLPHQNLERFDLTLDRVIGLAPDRISLFGYAHVPWKKPHMKLIKDDHLPDAELRIQILSMAVEKLDQAGYVFIGMDHFAKPRDPLVKSFEDGSLHRNFQGYTTMAGLEMLAFGATAISMLERMFVQNESRIDAYEDRIFSGQFATARGVRLSDDDLFRGRIINRLMCRFEIDIEAIEAEAEIDFDAYFPGVRDELEEFVQDGMLRRNNARFRVTPMGRLLIRNIAMVFDYHLKQMKAAQAARFSKTI